MSATGTLPSHRSETNEDCNKKLWNELTSLQMTQHISLNIVERVTLSDNINGKINHIYYHNIKNIYNFKKTTTV